MAATSDARLGRLDLNLFRVFDCVYRERNLSRAATVLHVSPSAVSHALARLRRELGDPLFVRERAGVAPTPVAERLAGDVAGALALLQQSLQRTSGFDPARDLSRVALAMSDTIEALVLPALVPHLRAHAPRVAIQSMRLDRASLRTELASGRVDLALDVAQTTPEDIHHRALWREELCVLSARRRRLDARAYLAADHVAVSSRRSGPSVDDVLLSRLGAHRRVVLRCQSLEAASRVVSETDLLLTLPRSYAERRRESFPGQLLRLPFDVPPLELHVYWHRQREHDPANRWMRDELVALARRAGA